MCAYVCMLMTVRVCVCLSLSLSLSLSLCVCVHVYDIMHIRACVIRLLADEQVPLHVWPLITYYLPLN